MKNGVFRICLVFFGFILNWNMVFAADLYVESSGSCGGKTPCYSTIQAAINVANSGDTIKVAQGIYAETFVLNSNKQLMTKGGWDTSFTTQTPGTTVIRAPIVTKGAIAFQELRIMEIAGPGGCTCTGTLNGTRWCDNGDGTVTDMTTCLVWLKYADWGGRKLWRNSSTDCSSPDYTCYDDAHTRAGILKDGTLIYYIPAIPISILLSDGSVEGDWRLPTKTELVGIIKGTEPVSPGQPRAFINVQVSDYWSSTTYSSSVPYLAWSVYMGQNYVDPIAKTYDRVYVWPVRSGN